MPNTLTINALVLKVSDYADNDRILSLLSIEKGRITVIVKGARSLKYRYLSAIQLFTYSAFELYEKGGMYWLKEALVNTCFPGLTDDIEKVALASYLSELSCELTDENESGQEMLRLLLNSFYMISARGRSLPFIKAVFELRSVCASGYMPDISGCRDCGNGSKKLYYFDIMNGCIICDECFSSHNITKDNAAASEFEGKLANASDTISDLGERNTYIPISAGVAMALRYLLSADHKRIFSFRLDNEKDEYDFSRLAETYTLWHLGRGFQSLTFYKSL